MQLLASEWSGPAALHVRELPVAFGASGEALVAALDEVHPDVVVAVGQAGGADAIRLERVAINLDDARIPDNAGAQPLDAPIDADGPAAYFSTLPVKAAAAAIAGRGIPAVVSHTAGTFVCNHVFYRLAAELARRPGMRGGFVHVPYGPEQVVGTDRPSLPIAQMAEALEVVVRTTLEHPDDVALPGGSLH